MCKACWDKERPGEEPLRAKEVEIERCSFCGMATTSGIYHRADPATVPYPRLVEEGE